MSAPYPSVYQLTGLNPAAVSSAQRTVAPIPGLERSIGPQGGAPKPWSPHSAMFWFAGFAAVAVGLIATSVDLKAGPLHASASAGK